MCSPPHQVSRHSTSTPARPTRGQWPCHAGPSYGIVMVMTGTHITLDDGTSLTLRAINEDDTERLMAMHRRLSEATVRRRFFAMLPELNPKQAHRFTHVDGTDRAAVVAATAEGDLVGVARYDRFPGTDDAEVAVVVQDDHQ